MTIHFNGIQDVADLYRDTYQLVDNGMWAAGDVLALAHEAGFGFNAILKACASERTVSRATVNNHMRTAIIFPPTERITDATWTLHLVAARQATMNDPSTHKTARDWLKKAVDNKWGKAQLEEAIAADNGNPKKGEPVYLLRNVEATLIGADEWTDKLVLLIPKQQLETWAMLQWHKVHNTSVRVTILQPATEVQQLDEEAA